MSAFRNSLRASVSMTSQPMDLDDAVCDTDLLSALDRHALLRTRTKQQSKSSNRWLSLQAVEAKRRRCPAERLYSRTRTTQDKCAYQ